MNNPFTKPHTRRLDMNVKHNPESQRLYNEARKYEQIRQHEIIIQADKAGIGLTPVEFDDLMHTADSLSQGVFSGFQTVVSQQLASLGKAHPERIRYSVLNDWMNDEMSDIEKAKREIVSWANNPKIVAFDTETTGLLDEGHVPVTAAACTMEGISLCDITMQALDEKGNVIQITEKASQANHLTDEIIAAFPPLENNEVAIISLESLMQDGRILAGYNTQFDRGMICRALMNATGRLRRIYNENSPDVNRAIERLTQLRSYFSDPTHWLETKDTFTRAIGLEPYPGPGKYTRLEDVARATRALTDGESQEHGALADCQLIAKIVQNIRKELNEMPKPKTAAKGPFPPAANPADNDPTDPEPAKDQAVEAAKAEITEYIESLENSLNEAQERIDAFEKNHVTMSARIRELENLCEQYQQTDGIKHHEARELTWCDLEINGFKFNWTIREGETVEAAVESAFKTVRALQAIRDTEKVKTFRVGLRDNWQPLKGFEKSRDGNERISQPSNEAPAQPQNERAATPKGNQPHAANKPSVPPQQQSQAPQGKTTGEKKQQQCDRIVRHQIDGQNTYDLPFTLSNGKPADRPFAPSKKDTGTLEKALIAAGFDPNTWEIGTEYDLPILVEWTVGPQIPKSDPPKFYRDNMTFTIKSEVATEEMPF